MQTFGERLTAARKAKGMTQEALAQAANVARNTISNWEHGRTIPDIDSVRRLSDALDVDLSQAAEEPSAPVDEDIPERQTPSASHNVNFSRGVERRAKTPYIIAGVAVLACAVLFFFLLFPRTPAPAGGRDSFNAEVFNQITPNEADKAYLTVNHRVWDESNGGTEYQMYDFTLTEQNGIGYSISRIEMEMEGKTGAKRTITMSAADLSKTLNPEIEPYGSVTIDGGFPKGEFLRGGMAVYGTDANGAPITFYSPIDF